MLGLVFNRNCVYQTAYHVVWCPKYRRSVLTGTVAESLSALLSEDRRSVLTGTVAESLSALLSEVCEENNWKILNLEIQPDHIHLFVSIPPSKSVSEAVKRLKGTTARKLFLKHPELKKQLWDGHLWSPTYYVGTAGNVSAETIRRYIERTEHIKGRR